ncbi:MAG: tripartite tricarboxylate transporter substrate-binding protein [Reyranella sp.]|uniref:Bug family tripartite tricarboxylate transporter substrate binding protein n=1 Tax=Reyranella sp. TaxID=1929291 RepID=UPI00273049A6|nr:tripartite tricarboxylate transporter substrate-binding protein [Reyranella sp.]MDP1964854.1 tripartite tricarboxylate transporter substrate-binding protein [Reyranella sp.]MDP2375243.1 tripartite tricarboxylate transporter substrate-binding protein [Reyranella sp.]
MLTIALLITMALATWAAPTTAQDYPSKPIRIIAPFGPGTATDTVARVIASELSRRTGQSVVVENKPGAERLIGAQMAAAAALDGYTIFVTTQTTQAINQHVYKALPYARGIAVTSPSVIPASNNSRQWPRAACLATNLGRGTPPMRQPARRGRSSTS